MFVIDEFFKSLLHAGVYPMFTCTCGIFGCGGYYVEVEHQDEELVWTMEQSPFADTNNSGHHTFVFSWDTIIDFSEELVVKLGDLNQLMQSHGIEFRFEVEKYRDIIHDVKHKNDESSQ